MGRTALHRAVEMGWLKEAAELLNAGANPLVKDKEGRDVFYKIDPVSCKEYSRFIAEKLDDLRKMLNPYRSDKRDEELKKQDEHLRAESDDIHGVLVSESDIKSGATIEGRLVAGVRRNSVDEVRAALSDGANPDVQFSFYETEFDKCKTTPLNYALKARSSVIARMLLLYHANVHKRGSYGDSPLINATRYDLTDLMKAILYRGAKVNAVNTKNETALFFADNPHTIKLLCKHKAEIDHQDQVGCTKLHCAVRYGTRAEIDCLLKLKANPSIKDKQGLDIYEKIDPKYVQFEKSLHPFYTHLTLEELADLRKTLEPLKGKL
jgi:ankyrin repeat protein